MKKVARKQTSKRKTSAVTKVINKSKKRGGKDSKSRKETQMTYEAKGYRGNMCLSMLGKTTYREERLFQGGESAPHHRKREQLLTLGKLAVAPKVKAEQESTWGNLIPPGVQMTVAGLLAAMVSGRMKPLYSIEGVSQAPKRAS